MDFIRSVTGSSNHKVEPTSNLDHPADTGLVGRSKQIVAEVSEQMVKGALDEIVSVAIKCERRAINSTKHPILDRKIIEALHSFRDSNASKVGRFVEKKLGLLPETNQTPIRNIIDINEDNINGFFGDLIDRVDNVVKSEKYPFLNKLLNSLIYQEKTNRNQVAIVVELIKNLEHGFVNFNALMSLKNVELSHEVLNECRRFESNVPLADLVRRIYNIANPDEYPNLHQFLSTLHFIARHDRAQESSLLTLIDQLEQGTMDVEALKLFMSDMDASTKQELTELQVSGLLPEPSSSDKPLESVLIAKELLSVTAELAEAKITKSIEKSYGACSQQISKWVDREVYTDLREYLDVLNDSFHLSLIKTGKSLIDNEDNPLFDLINDLSEGKVVKGLRKLVTIEGIPQEVINDAMVLIVDVGGDVGKSGLESLFTSIIKGMFKEKGVEWTSQDSEDVNANISKLVQSLQGRAKKAIRSRSKGPNFLGRITASSTLSQEWGSGAYLAFMQPASGADILVRLLAALVSNGGTVAATGTELLATVIPDRLHNSELSLKIAEKLQKATEPAKQFSKDVDAVLNLSPEGKRITLQGGTAFLLGSHGVMGSYSTPFVVRAVGSVLGHFELANSEHFGQPRGLLSEDTLIKLGMGALTTGVVEGYVRPSMGDGSATLAYMTGNLVTTLSVSMIRESWAWDQIKSGVRSTANDVGIGAVNYFLGRKR